MISLLYSYLCYSVVYGMVFMGSQLRSNSSYNKWQKPFTLLGLGNFFNKE